MRLSLIHRVDTQTDMKHWYVVRTKPRKEGEAEENLRRQAFETYLPKMQQVRHRRSTWTKVTEPLFPRYLFVYMDMQLESVAPIRSTRGVSQLIKFGQHIQPVDPEVIEFLKEREDLESGCYVREEKPLTRGDNVEIHKGPFAGLEGVYEQASGEERAIILLNYLGGKNRVSLPREQISER